MRQLYVSAFSGVEREAVAGLAINLLAETTTPVTLSLVAETKNDLVGHVGFSAVACSRTGHGVGYILAPLAVHPDLQKQGVGTALIESGLEEVSAFGAAIVFVYGDPGYYGRFGFDARIAAQYVPPYQLQHEFAWQAKPLKRHASCPAPATLTCVPSLMDPELW